MDILEYASGMVPLEISSANGDGSRFALGSKPDDIRGRVRAKVKSAPRSNASGAPAMPAAVADNWNKLAAAPISPRLFRDIVRFAMRTDGWRGSGSLALSGRSVGSFVDFCTAFGGVAVEPDLALTASGGLQAQWHKSRRHVLDLTFDADGKVYFGLFKGQGILEGVDTVDAVVNILRNEPSRPLTWKR